MSVNTAIGLIAVAKQADKKTPAAEAKFSHGLTGGQVFKLDRTVESANVTCGVRAGTDSYVDSISTGVDFDTYGYSNVLPLYFYGAMGNIISAAGTESGTYKHTIKLGDVLPYFTFWGRIGSDLTRTDGVKIDQLEMEFEGNKPLSFGITGIGMGAALGLEAIPGAADDPSGFDGYFVPTGGTFKVDTSSATPVVANVIKGSLSLSNSCETSQFAGQITPGAVDEGKLQTGGSITIKPDDLSDYKKLVTGSASGTTPTGVMVYGSFEWNFKHSKNAKHTLKITSGRVPFTCDFPEVSPDGGAAELEFSFDDIGIDSRDGSPITVEIVNETASYN